MAALHRGAEGSPALAKRISPPTIISMLCLFAVLGLYPRLGNNTSSDSQLSSVKVQASNAAGAGAATATAAPAAGAATKAAAAAAPEGEDSAAAAAPSSRATTRWFKPQGYDLPDACWEHEEMYTMVFDNLRPWMARGITKKDLDACTPVAAADMNTTYGTPGQQFRLLMWNNEAIITSGGLRRNAGQEGLEYYQISQIQDAAWRFGLPNMEFAVGFGDMSSIAGERDGGLCPLMIYCKKPDHYDILIPDGQFTQYMYDTWLEKNRMDNYGEPWDKKVDKAVGRYTGYCSAEAMTGRFGVSEKCIRLAYSNHSRDTKHEFTDLKLVEPMPLAEHRKWKYTVHLDGIGCSNRLQKLMATGLTILKQDSTLTEFFYGGLRPWVHYVPTGYNGVDEVSRMVQFLRKNDDMAKAIGEQARKFAHEHLSEEGRLCYIKVLFEETKKLMQYEPKLVDFPNTITFDDEMKDHVVLKDNHHMALAETT